MNPTNKRGRPPTGCPEWNPAKQVWEARILLDTGQRRHVPMPGIAEHDAARATALARTLALRAKSGGFVPDEARERVNEWFERWCKARTAKGLVTVRNDRSRFVKWISPVLGTKPMAGVTRRDVEEVVQALDRAVRADALGWKTATNVWGVATRCSRTRAGRRRSTCAYATTTRRATSKGPTAVWNVRGRTSSRAPLKIMRAAGHDDLRTTQRYINEAQTFEGDTFGEPFPSVPLSSLSIFGSNYGFLAVENSRIGQKIGVEQRPQGDIRSGEHQWLRGVEGMDVADRPGRVTRTDFQPLDRFERGHPAIVLDLAYGIDGNAGPFGGTSVPALVDRGWQPAQVCPSRSSRMARRRSPISRVARAPTSCQIPFS